MEEEEGELFDKAKDVLTDEQLEMLGDEMAAEKQRKGLPVAEELRKPSLLTRAVNAVFGSSEKPAAKKKAAKRKAAKATTKKTAAKKTVKRAKKSSPKPLAKKSTGRQKRAGK